MPFLSCILKCSLATIKSISNGTRMPWDVPLTATVAVPDSFFFLQLSDRLNWPSVLLLYQPFWLLSHLCNCSFEFIFNDPFQKSNLLGLHIPRLFLRPSSLSLFLIMLIHPIHLVPYNCYSYSSGIYAFVSYFIPRELLVSFSVF